jgi:hypothetical protein
MPTTDPGGIDLRPIPSAESRAAAANSGVNTIHSAEGGPVSAEGPVETDTGGEGDMAGLVDTGRFDDATETPVATEDIPGFIDSSLYAKYTPDHVETEEVQGLDANPSAGKFGDDHPAVIAAEGEELPCQDCGTPHAREVCPGCGARRNR